MGFLDKLWDDTVAGPAPESGLGKLRKYGSLSSALPRSLLSDPNNNNNNNNSNDFPVSRCITIVRSNSVGAAPSSSNSNCTTPTSPFSPSRSPRAGDFTFNRWKKKDRLSAIQRPPDDHDTISPIVYDWIMINALDR